MRNQQNETGQISLFATQSFNEFEKNLGQTQALYSLRSQEDCLVCNVKPSNSLSRSSDPKTSKVAGEKAKVFKQTHIDRIYEALKGNGKMIPEEIAERAGMRADQVWKRRKEMADGGWIEVLEETRNGCALWKAK